MKALLLLSTLFITFASQALQLKAVVSDLNQPVDVKFFPSSNDQMLIAGKEGQLTFANLSDKSQYNVHEFKVKSGSEMGLLGLAFHPEYADNSYLFINYFPKKGDRVTRVSRFELAKKDNKYSLLNEKVILEIEQPYRNHNGGQIAFGPDGYLYIGMGDGGSGGDPKGHGQNTQTLLGAMLRIDINTPNNVAYTVPSDNPFVGNTNYKPEIWAYGLRNPWRFSFAGNTLIAADVGQNKFEEVSIIEKGQNLGWNIMEATHCFEPKKNCNQDNLVLPKIEYPRSEGQSITGGYVYRGTLLPNLKQHYIYADFLSGNIWAADFPKFSATQKLLSKQGNLSTFALSDNGEIYVAGYAKGKVYQLVP